MQGEEDGEHHDLGRLRVGGRQADGGEAPAERVGEEQDEQHPAEEEPDVGPDAEAHGVTRRP